MTEWSNFLEMTKSAAQLKTALSCHSLGLGAHKSHPWAPALCSVPQDQAVCTPLPLPICTSSSVLSPGSMKPGPSCPMGTPGPSQGPHFSLGYSSTYSVQRQISWTGAVCHCCALILPCVKWSRSSPAILFSHRDLLTASSSMYLQLFCPTSLSLMWHIKDLEK